MEFRESVHLLRMFRATLRKPARRGRSGRSLTSDLMSEQPEQSLTAHLFVEDGRKAIEFYQRAFGAIEEHAMPWPGGTGVMHATLRFGNSYLMLHGDEEGNCSPRIEGNTVTVNLRVHDVDTVFHLALALGADQTMALADQFWGDRYGKLKDPFGIEWALMTRIEKPMTHAEMQRAAEQTAGHEA
jgi:PhnB protein